MVQFPETPATALQTPTLAVEDVALLRAALCNGETAKSAYALWRSLATPEHTHNEAHFRLTPLLYDNLKRIGLQDDLSPRLKQVHRRSWGQAQIRLREAETVLTALSQAGVQTMVTKGIALIDGYYRDAALRPMADIDIIVRHADVMPAFEALGKAGWSNDADVFENDLSRRTALIRGLALTFEREGATDVDFHWQPFHECMSRVLREQYWDHSEEITVRSQTCLRPSANHLLFHVITHGMRPNVFNPMRWIADAAIIIREGKDKIDWPALYRYARKARMLKRLTMGLEEMKRVLGGPIAPPPPRLRPSFIEHLEQRAFQSTRDEQDFEGASRKMLWPTRLRMLVNDPGRSPSVWLSYASSRFSGRS